jgi:hypothetical protein
MHVRERKKKSEGLDSQTRICSLSCIENNTEHGLEASCSCQSSSTENNRYKTVLMQEISQINLSKSLNMTLFLACKDTTLIMKAERHLTKN